MDTPEAAASCALKSCPPSQDLGPAVEPLAAVALLGAVLDLDLEQPWCGKDGAAQCALLAMLEHRWHLEAVSLSWAMMLALLLASLSLSGAGSHLRSQKRALQKVVRLLTFLRAGVQAGGEAAQALLGGSLGADA